MFALLDFRLALVQDFLGIHMWIPFRTGITTVCYCMLEVCDLLQFGGDLSQETVLSLHRDSEFRFFNSLE